MFVQRLKAEFARALSALVGMLKGRAPALRRPTAPPLTPIAAHRSARRSGLASGTWLDDARRLRARPPARPALPPPAREQLRRILRDPQWAAAYDATAATRQPRTSHPTEHRTEGPTRDAAPSRPLAPPSRAPSPEAQAARDQRRLAFVRDLVRRGIYNEGFAPSELPEQYRRRPDGA